MGRVPRQTIWSERVEFKRTADSVFWRLRQSAGTAADLAAKHFDESMVPRHYLNLSRAAWQRSAAVAGRSASSFKYLMLSRWLTLVENLARPLPDLDTSLEILFVVGHWRSGTTLLFELICADGNAAFPTTTACLNPQSFLLNPQAAAPAASRTLARPMDRMHISAATPQEDEFALFLLGAPSPYALLLYPKLLQSIAELSDVAALPAPDRETWMRTFSCFLSAIPTDAKPLVLKSPPHSFRIATLAQKFPRAKFIYLARNPLEVFASASDMWMRMWDLYALAAVPDKAEMDAGIVQTMNALDVAATSALQALPSERWTTLRYEDLLREPKNCLTSAGSHLNLSFLESHGAGRLAAIDAMSSYQSNQHSLTRAEENFVRTRCSALFTRYGYEIS